MTLQIEIIFGAVDNSGSTYVFGPISSDHRAIPNRPKITDMTYLARLNGERHGEQEEAGGGVVGAPATRSRRNPRD